MTVPSFTAVVSGNTTVTARGPVRDAAERMLGRLWIDQVPVRLASEDPALWPSAATAADDGRALCWPGQPGFSRAILPQIGELRAKARAEGLTELALLGRGAPARAAGLIVRNSAAARPLTLLESAEPGPVVRTGADHERLRQTMVVVTGDDAATETLRRVFVRMFQDLDLSPAQIARRFVTVAEPGGPAAKRADEAGHPLIEAPGRTPFGALSPYALVPAALAGTDVARLLDHATTVLPALTRPENNPGLVLGAILGGAARAGRTTVVLGDYPASLPGLADWVAVLLAEATGGRMLPLVQHGGQPVVPSDDVFLVTLDGRPRQDDATVTAPPSAQLVVWEYAAAVAAQLLGMDPLAPLPGAPAPHDPPAGSAPSPSPAEESMASAVLTEGEPGQAVEVHTHDPVLAGATDLAGLFDALAERVGADGHLAIVAHLDPDRARGQGTQVRRLGALLAARCARPVTISWGHRYPAIGNDRRERGVYLVLTGNVVHDVPVPDRHYRLSRLQLAQALSEARAARSGGCPVVRLHLQNRWAGLARLLESARGEA
ncbi:glucose-6-phosphate isomerase [Actinomadura rudentiformis]|uniref:Glucose-6-phosphate isomerase n=1 Tax=Actinomadura rudentiformis TaxID=359158 RepID=A0A6H9YMT8_9ACTN|nr:glucose-6-phosphate isomerase [Actinomadura rudentiformis]KAB2348851.1 glucose-6-phosphate isomerase [Actinomadura rudentiformis]